MRASSGSTSDFLEALCEEARLAVSRGYYGLGQAAVSGKRVSLVGSIERCLGNAVIAELKRASPSGGALRRGLDPLEAVMEMERGGAAGISILTAPRWFDGSLSDLAAARSSTRLPVLMKDIVVSLSQIEAAARLGADSILLIYRVFRRGYADLGLRDAVLAAHGLGLEVLLEACGREELLECLSADVELLGVNARDLSTLVVDKRVHEEAVRDVDVGGRVLVAESGIETAADVRRLRRLGYKAFLVGTALMRAGNIESKVRELVRA